MDQYDFRLALKAHLFVSVSFGLLFVGTAVQDMLSVGTYYIWIICFACPGIAILILTISSLFFLRPEIEWSAKYAPLAINLLTAGIGVLIVLVAPMQDWAFSIRANDYERAVELVEQSQVTPDKFGRARLPSSFKAGSALGSIVIIKNAASINVLFFDGYDSWDNVGWGYLYAPEGAILQDRIGCGKWRPLKPKREHWLYCEAFSPANNWPFLP